MHKNAGFFLNCDMRKTPSAQDLITLFVKWKKTHMAKLQIQEVIGEHVRMQRIQECR